jgi:hypothetical protein
VLADGQRGPPFDDVGRIVVSPDGKHMSYAARTEASWVVVTDGVQGQAWGGTTTPVFSRDGRRLAYAARKGSKSVVVVDNQAGPECDAIPPGVPCFDDSGRVEYVAIKQLAVVRVVHP